MKPFKTADSYAADLQQAYDYFKRGGSKPADRFLARYEKVLRTIMGNPLICRLRPTGWRRMNIPRSHYAIFYREAPDFWFLGGVVSAVQDPDVIQATLLIREIREADLTRD